MSLDCHVCESECELTCISCEEPVCDESEGGLGETLCGGCRSLLSDFKGAPGREELESRLSAFEVRIKELESKLVFLRLQFSNQQADGFEKPDLKIVVQNEKTNYVYAHKLVLKFSVGIAILAHHSDCILLGIFNMNCKRKAVIDYSCSVQTTFQIDGGPWFINFLDSRKSPVFCKMFNSKMLVEEAGTVRIDDATLPVMRAVVKFCYDAEITFNDEVACEDVLAVAHKYEIAFLLTMCEEHLMETLSNDNLPKRFKVAKKFDRTRLETAATRHLKNNYDAVISCVIAELCEQGKEIENT